MLIVGGIWNSLSCCLLAIHFISKGGPYVMYALNRSTITLIVCVEVMGCLSECIMKCLNSQYSLWSLIMPYESFAVNTEQCIWLHNSFRSSCQYESVPFAQIRWSCQAVSVDGGKSGRFTATYRSDWKSFNWLQCLVIYIRAWDPNVRSV